MIIAYFLSFEINCRVPFSTILKVFNCLCPIWTQILIFDNTELQCRVNGVRVILHHLLLECSIAVHVIYLMQLNFLFHLVLVHLHRIKSKMLMHMYTFNTYPHYSYWILSFIEIYLIFLLQLYRILAKCFINKKTHQPYYIKIAVTFFFHAIIAFVMKLSFTKK